MPYYDFEDTNTGERMLDVLMSNAEREQYLKDNPHIKQLILVAAAIGDPVRLGLKKADSGFRDLLKDIKKRNSRGRNKINAD